MITVADPDDPRLAIFRRNERGLSNRPQRRNDAGDGLFLAEGDLVVERALAAGCTPVLALVDADRPPDITARLEALVDVYAGTGALRASVTDLGVPQTVVALFRRPSRPEPLELAAGARRLVIVEAVDNPANVGSIVRNAAGLGWGGLILDRTSADPLARRALRTSMGHALGLPHARTMDVAGLVGDLRRRGFALLALTPTAGAVDLASVAGDDRLVAGRIAVLIGAERIGLSPTALAAASMRVRIPMEPGVDSLNVAATSAVVCYALRGVG